MADITVNNVVTGNTVSSISYTPPSLTDAVLVVQIANENNSGDITDVSFGGTSLTLAISAISHTSSGFNNFAETYYLVNPGTSNANVVITGGGTRTLTTILTLDNVDQTTPIDATDKAESTGSSSSISGSITTVADAALVLSVGNNSTGNLTVVPDGSQIEVTDFASGSLTTGTSKELKATAGSLNQGFVFSSSGSRSALAMVSFKNSGGATTFFQSVSGSMTPSGALQNQISKTLDGAVPAIGGLELLIQKLLSGSNTPSGALATQTVITQGIAGSFTPSGDVSKQIAKILLGSSTPSGTIQKQINKLLSGSVTLSGDLQKRIAKVLDGSLTPTGTVLAAVVILVQLAGQVIMSGFLAALFIAGVTVTNIFKNVFRSVFSNVFKDIDE